MRPLGTFFAAVAESFHADLELQREFEQEWRDMADEAKDD